MTWIAILIGVAAFAATAALGRSFRPASTGAAAGLLRVLGGSGLFALAAAAALGAAPLGALVAGVAALAVILDARSAVRGLRARLPRRRPSTVTPFHNAT